MRFLLLSLITAYKQLVSPLLGTHCRFLPTCSDYAAQAVRSHGAAKGGLLALKRLCRCHPLAESKFDPVP